MAVFGNLPLQTSFMHWDSSNLTSFPKRYPLRIAPFVSHMSTSIIAKNEKQWGRRGETMKSITAKFEDQRASFRGERETIKPITVKFEKQWASFREETMKPISTTSTLVGSWNQVGEEVGISREGLNLQPMNEEALLVKKPKKVAVFWDLDNKPPKVPPFDAAIAVREMAGKFGEIVNMAAYANRHAFSHVPQWVVEERRERKKLDFMESKGIVKPDQPYICGVCGRKCKTNADMKKHFKQLHERERHKKLSRMNSLKGKRRAKFKEQFKVKDEKYQNAARNLLFPKVGYGLASELRRAGVYVKTVEDKPQAADAALKRQIEHSMTRGIDFMFLISDDTDFSKMLDKARQNNMRTVVLGDSRALLRHADLLLSWERVSSGMAWDEIDTVVRKWFAEEAVLDEILDLQDTVMDVHYNYDSGENESDSDIDQIVDMIVKSKDRFSQDSRVSAFSEEEQQLQEEDATKNRERDFYDEDGWDSDEDEEIDIERVLECQN